MSAWSVEPRAMYDVIANERKRWLKDRERIRSLPSEADDVAWWSEFGDHLGWDVIEHLGRHRAVFRTKHGGDIAITDLIRREIEDGWAPYQRALKAAGIVLGREA